MSAPALAPPPAAPGGPADDDALRDGMRMNRPEFHRRYELICETDADFRAELIGGVVHLREPMSAGNPHATFCLLVSLWLGEYWKRTAGVKAAGAPTVQLDDLGEPEPDAVLRRADGPAAAGFLAGPQELVVEVSDSTLRKDLGPKFRDYQRAGVPEYLVVDLPSRRVRWFARDPDGRFRDLPADADGLYKSREFPGLWLDPAALFAEDPAGIEAAVAAGVAAREA